MADPEISHRESLSVCVRVRVRVRVRVCIRARWCARCPRSAIGNRRASLPPLLRPIQRAARHPPSWTRIQCQPRPSRSQQRPAARRELAALEALQAREDARQAARGRVASATRSRARPVGRQRPSTSETVAAFGRKAEHAWRPLKPANRIPSRMKWSNQILCRMTRNEVISPRLEMKLLDSITSRMTRNRHGRAAPIRDSFGPATQTESLKAMRGRMFARASLGRCACRRARISDSRPIASRRPRPIGHVPSVTPADHVGLFARCAVSPPPIPHPRPPPPTSHRHLWEGGALVWVGGALQDGAGGIPRLDETTRR